MSNPFLIKTIKKISYDRNKPVFEKTIDHVLKNKIQLKIGDIITDDDEKHNWIIEYRYIPFGSKIIYLVSTINLNE